MDKVKGQCPECKGLFKAQPEWAGMRAQCPHCGASIIVQLIEEPSAPAVNLSKQPLGGQPVPPPVPGAQGSYGASAQGVYPPPQQMNSGVYPPPQQMNSGVYPPQQQVSPYNQADSYSWTPVQGRANQAPPPPVAVSPNGYADGQQYPYPEQQVMYDSSQYGRNPGIFYWFIKCFKKYFTFSGRARRAECWSFALCNFLVNFALGYMAGAIEMSESSLDVFIRLYQLASLIPGLAVTVRRLHDIGKSGWNLLWAFVPLIGWLVLLCFEAKAGETGANEYGEDPKVSPEI